MIDKTFVQKILRSTLRRSRGLSDHHLMHPMREWFGGLAVALVFLVAGTSWCVYLYFEYSTTEPETAAEIDAPTSIYQKAAVESALAELKARTDRHETVKRRLEAGRTPLPITSEAPEVTDSATSAVSSSTTETTPTAEPVSSPEMPAPQSDMPEAL